MSARSKARKRALDVLYSADLRSIPISEALADEERRALTEPERDGPWRYARQIVEGVIARQTEIDELIETYSHGWPLERMPPVDRAILRIGAWETLYNDDVPVPVAISEAVTQASLLSTEESAQFVNGLLATISRNSP